jgi:Flp pilus assembly protein TadG
MENQSMCQRTQQRRGLLGLRRSVQSGQVLAEFGIMIPVIVLLIIGAVDFGRVIMTRQVMTNAAREGASVGIYADANTESVTNSVKSYLEGAGLKPSNANITVTGVHASIGQPVIVSVNYPVTSLAMKFIHSDNNTWTLSATSSMPHE